MRTEHYRHYRQTFEPTEYIPSSTVVEIGMNFPQMNLSEVIHAFTEGEWTVLYQKIMPQEGFIMQVRPQFSHRADGEPDITMGVKLGDATLGQVTTKHHYGIEGYVNEFCYMNGDTKVTIISQSESPVLTLIK